MPTANFVLASASPGAVPLFQEGPTLTATLRGPLGQVAVPVGIDTESTISGADLGLLQQIGSQPLPASGTPVTTPSGGAVDYVYPVSLIVDGVDLMAGLPGALGESLPAPGPRVLLGRDVLSSYSLWYNGPAGSWSLLSGTPVPAPGGSLLDSIGLAAAGSLLALVVWRKVNR